MTKPDTCRDCDNKLGKGNVSGYCFRHISAANARNPEWRERQRQGLIKKLRSDPEYLERKRADMRNAGKARDIEALRIRMRERRYWEKSNAERPPGHPSRIKAGQSLTNSRLADIPPHLREEYRHLTRVKHIPAAEARAMILAQDRAEVSRLRIRMGEPTAEVEVALKSLKPVLLRVAASAPYQPKPTALFAAVARAFHIPLEGVLGRSRDRNAVRCRQTIYAILRADGHSFLRIARWMGRDHSTIMHGVEHFDSYAKQNPTMRTVFDQFTQREAA